MANVFITKKSSKSKLSRLSFLPRIGLTIDFAGKQFSYFQVSMIEAFWNMPRGQRTVANLIKLSEQQIKEIKLPSVNVSQRVNKRIKAAQSKARQSRAKLK